MNTNLSQDNEKIKKGKEAINCFLENINIDKNSNSNEFLFIILELLKDKRFSKLNQKL